MRTRSGRPRAKCGRPRRSAPWTDPIPRGPCTANEGEKDRQAESSARSGSATAGRPGRSGDRPAGPGRGPRARRASGRRATGGQRARHQRRASRRKRPNPLARGKGAPATGGVADRGLRPRPRVRAAAAAASLRLTGRRPGPADRRSARAPLGGRAHRRRPLGGVGRDRPARPGRSIVPQDPESRRLLIVMPSPAACRRGSPPGRRPQHGLSAAGVSGSIRLTTSRATHRRL
ncbi:MAG: hypothetical protein QOD86_630, partial [Miltoncostaeaceae bacterium]|nr:hypothetical protein [Miltoncostaeaceae bacterium]